MVIDLIKEMSKKEIIDDVNVSKFKSMKGKERSLLLRYNVLAQGVYAGLYMSVMGVFILLFVSLLTFEVLGVTSGTIPVLAALFLCWKAYGYWKHYKFFKMKAQKIWDSSGSPEANVFEKKYEEKIDEMKKEDVKWEEKGETRK